MSLQVAPAPQPSDGITQFAAVPSVPAVGWSSGALQPAPSNAGTFWLTGQLSVGSGAQAPTGYGVYIAGNSIVTGGAFQIGLMSGATYDSGATSWCAAVYAKVTTSAASYTQGTAFVFAAGSPTLGSGSAITSLYGLYVYNLGAAGVSNVYGVYISSQSGAATTNLGLWNAGTTRLDGALNVNGLTQFSQSVSIGNQAAVSQVGLNMVFNLSGIGVSGISADQCCQKIVGVFSSAATSGMGLYFQPTSGSSNTFSNIWAFYIDGANLGTSPCTNYYGLRIQNQGRAATTNSYGIWIEPQSSSTVTNVGLWNAGTTQLVGVLNVGDGNAGIIDVSRGVGGGGMTMAPGATWTPFGVGNNFSGLIVIDETIVYGRPATFLTGGTQTVLTGDDSGGAQWSVTQNTSGKMNVYCDAANSYSLTVQNSTSNTIHVQVLGLRVRTQQ